MSTPLFTWKLPKGWPDSSFFGRRWAAWFDGYRDTPTPSNGCIYFWGVLVSTIFWALLLIPSFLFKRLFGLTQKELSDKPVSSHAQQKEAIDAQIPLPFKLIGKAIHFVFATRYSPFRLTGRFCADNAEILLKTVALLFVAAALSASVGILGFLMIFETINLLIVLGSLVGMILAGIILLVFMLWLLERAQESDSVESVVNMLESIKYRMCPMIENPNDSRKNYRS